MRRALALARRALGRAAPNPAVGCVIVSAEGRVVGRGWTAPGGRPHAETMALANAGALAKGATAYVTLEPCAHYGLTSPCAEALAKAGVRRLVGAATDPDPRVNGRGFALLRAGGVDVSVGVLGEEAVALNRGFFLRITKDRPLVTLKMAQSRDGKTIPAHGSKRWITNEDSRRFAHLLRAKHDAILVGIGTVLADDPLLTCRLPGLENRSPVRVILDRQLRTPEFAKVVETAWHVPTLILTAVEAGDHLRTHGAEVLKLPPNAQGRLPLSRVLQALALRGHTRLLVEGGATTISEFLREGFADELEIFTARTDLGDSAQGHLPELAAALISGRYEKIGLRYFGTDMLETYRLRA
ncbi:MAG: bifunctional diaminohydroxyphosphoribosylaminopyrimidine deaminase/5-amino-6-(5-phosphoribosylamino)uracil reductase RibD [Alphaproteobacteria bacterium]|nr:bifunctional diaminohydroxyphosphoribosylaminopyrimidine deaminase/5-amino-6-(5-phosphoribosylamino)uracil reductase RibD [Alphaproteobacteria bacterium]